MSDNKPSAAGLARVAETLRRRAAFPTDSDHVEWLLDEALTETFPASDPIAPAIPPEPAAAPSSGSAAKGLAAG